MSFNVRIKFTGICTFVPNKPFDQHPTRVWVLLPNGERWPAPGADERGLRRHIAFVRFNTVNMRGFNSMIDQPSVAIWYLGKGNPLETWSLTFECPGAAN